MDAPTQPWDLGSLDPGRDWNDPQRLHTMLAHAVLAPSSHNAQPWLFRPAGGGGVELFADRRRALPVADPDDRELIISCGAALGHLKLAMAHLGREPRVAVLPDPDGQPDLLARVTPGEPVEPDTAREALVRAIAARRTDRRVFDPRPLEAGVAESLTAEAAREGAGLAMLTDRAERFALADLVAEADYIQMADRRFRRELASWIHANRSHSRDGMPGYAHGMSDLLSLLGPVVIRTFDVGGGQAAKDRDVAEHSPALALLYTEDDDERSWLAAGQALSRVLLRAQALGVHASHMNQPIQLPETRPDVARAAKIKGCAQILLRLGYAEGEVPPTPRRRVNEVLLPD